VVKRIVCFLAVSLSIGLSNPTLSKLPFYFEPNAGQARSDALYLSRGSNYAVWLAGSGGIHLEVATGEARHCSLGMAWLGGNPHPRIEPVDLQEGRSNYFIGVDPQRWRTNVPHYGAVRYAEIYPGIALVVHGRQGELEYDLELSPGADPGRIQLQFSGLKKLSISRRGDLTLSFGDAVVVQHTPRESTRRKTASGQPLPGVMSAWDSIT